MVVRRALFQNGRSAKRSRTSLNRTVSRAINARTETKFRAFSTTFLSNPTTGTNVELNAMSTGPDNGDRIGNRVNNLRVTGLLAARGTGTVRIILYCPKKATTALSTATRFGSINTSDFWVLHDKVYNPGLSFAGNDGFAININKKLNFHTHWGSSSNNDFQRNPLKLYMVSDNQGGTVGTVEGHFKVFYKDS